MGGFLGDRRCHVGEFADDDAAVTDHRLLEFDQGAADRDHVARLGVDHRNRAGGRRGHFDDGLVGLHREQRLVGDHVVANLDVPGDDLGLLQSFAEVGQRERFHA